MSALWVRALLAGLALAAVACENTSNNAAPSGAGGAGLGSGGGGTGGAAGNRDAGGAGGDDAGLISVEEAPYLWYAGGRLAAFRQSETRASHERGPGLVVAPDYPSAKGFHDLAFDSAGNLWTIPLSGDRILRLPGDKLTGTAPPIPNLVISSPSLANAQSLVFDAQGNLWVLNYAGAGPSVATVVRFDDPRAAAGNQTLAATTTIGPGTTADGVARFSQATAIAFDAAGNLWLAAVANVLRFSGVGALRGEVAPAPAAVITSGDAYVSIAFDAAGSLWVSGAGNGYFAMRIANPGALTGMVLPPVAAKVRLPVGTSLFAGGMGFDADGALWIAMSRDLLRIPGAAALTGTVDAQPAVVLGLTSGPDLASKVLLRPTPAGLPIYW